MLEQGLAGENAVDGERDDYVVVSLRPEVRLGQGDELMLRETGPSPVENSKVPKSLSITSRQLY
jgi:hypothetical protein